MAQYVSGLSGSGIDVSSLVNSLMQVERLPQQRLATRKADAVSRAAAWGDLVTRVGALQTTASGLSSLEAVRRPAVVSSLPATLTATPTDGATARPGIVALRVHALATSSQLATGAYADPDAPVVAAGTTARAVVASGVGLGILRVTAGASTEVGAHTVEVTRPSEGALLTAASTYPVSFAAPTSVDFTLDGGAVRTASFAAGESYPDAESLAEALRTKLGTTDLEVAVDAGGNLTVATSAHGAARSLVVSGAGAAALGFGDGDTATGANGWVSVDGSDEVEVTAMDGRTATTLPAGLSVVAGARLVAGSARADVVELAGGSTLAQVAATLNAAGAPATASVVGTTGGSRLVLTAAATGAAAGISLSTDLPDDALRTSTIRGGTDAVLGIGTLRITRPGNTVTDVVAGVTLSLVKADPAADVTIDVRQDADALLTKAKALVDGLNQTISSVASKTRYSVATASGGPLVGENAAREVVTRMNAAVSGVVGTGEVTSASRLGIRVGRDGTWSLDEAVFRKALSTHPDDATAVLAAVGTAVADTAKAAAGPGGTLKTRQEGENSAATSLQAAADAWATRLTATEDRYRRQFSRLEGLIGTLRSQGNWLSGQIGGLPSWQ